jgi:hypothetical protein
MNAKPASDTSEDRPFQDISTRRFSQASRAQRHEGHRMVAQKQQQPNQQRGHLLLFDEQVFSTQAVARCVDNGRPNTRSKHQVNTTV